MIVKKKQWSKFSIWLCKKK